MVQVIFIPRNKINEGKFLIESIFDEQILKGKIDRNEVIDISSLPDGLYLLTISMADENYSIKKLMDRKN